MGEVRFASTYVCERSGLQVRMCVRGQVCKVRMCVRGQVQIQCIPIIIYPHIHTGGFRPLGGSYVRMHSSVGRDMGACPPPPPPSPSLGPLSL